MGQATAFVVLLLGLALVASGQDLREAARLDQAGRCGEAEGIYRKALAVPSPGLSVLNNAGNHYVICGQPEKARELFERVLRASPGHVNATEQLARLAMGGGRFAEAEELWKKLAAGRPGEFVYLFELGRAGARAGHLESARRALEAALLLRPEDVGALTEAGLANAAMGDYTRAVFLLARAESKAPKVAGIALALARAAEDAGFYGDAVLAYERYLALVPKNDAARRDCARAMAFTSSRAAEGERELEEYVAGHPRDALGHFYLGQVKWKRDADGALASLAEAVRLDPRLAAAHVARAWLLRRMGRDAEALTQLDAALLVEPKNVRAMDLKGLALAGLDRAGEAEAVLRKAAGLAPRDADVALHLGRVLMELGKEAEGQKWLDAYARLRPARQRDARSEAGMIELATLDLAARRARQIERFRAMARSRPDDALLQVELAGLLLEDGQRAEALREYRTLLTRAADGALYARAGRALAEVGEFALALAMLEKGGGTDWLLLARDGRLDEAARWLEGARGDRAVALWAALVLGLRGDVTGASELLRKLAVRWPEWDLPWLAQGLLLRGAGREGEAVAKLRTAASLGSGEGVRKCGSLKEWVTGQCGK